MPSDVQRRIKALIPVTVIAMEESVSTLLKDIMESVTMRQVCINEKGTRFIMTRMVLSKASVE